MTGQNCVSLYKEGASHVRFEARGARYNYTSLLYSKALEVIFHGKNISAYYYYMNNIYITRMEDNLYECNRYKILPVDTERCVSGKMGMNCMLKNLRTKTQKL